MDAGGASHIHEATIANDNVPGRNGQINVRRRWTHRQFRHLSSRPCPRQVITAIRTRQRRSPAHCQPRWSVGGVLSNREGAWKLYVVSIDGGAARLLAPIRGDFGDWQLQGWIR